MSLHHQHHGTSQTNSSASLTTNTNTTTSAKSQQNIVHSSRYYSSRVLQPFVPPRPPSTTSSGSVSTSFPDDIQDEIPLAAQEQASSSAGHSQYAFQPAHHSLLYHRHTSPHFPPQHHLLHHYSGPHHSASIDYFSVPHEPTPSSNTASRAGSRNTYVGEDDPVEEQEQDNLLLVDNSVGVQDAVYLDPVTTDNFLTNVVQRFKRDFIYTYVGEGTLLVSVNPYKPLSIFSQRVKAAYRNVANPFQLPPHIYGQLCLILQRNVSSLERTQTLLLTGESGSGKSTTLAYLLDFLAMKQEPYPTQQPRSRRNSGRSTSGGPTGTPSSTKAGSYYLSTGSLHRHQHSDRGGGSGRASSLSLSAPSNTPSKFCALHAPSTHVPNHALTLLQGNFLLSAFGNCKTSKNWDASRFGKLVQLHVDYLGNIAGGRIVTYQLEKWRVQGPIGGFDHYERNFHIFYILLAGADSSTLKTLRLTRNLETYASLNVKNHSSFLNSTQTTSYSAPFCPHDHYYSSRSTATGARGSIGFYERCFSLVKTTLGNVLPGGGNINTDHVLRMLAAILKLNNLVFAPVANIDGTEGCDVTNEQDLHDIGMLLQILPPSVLPTTSTAPNYPFSSPSTPNQPGSNNNSNNHPLKSILTTRRVTRTDGSIANIELTASESCVLRNSLTVSLYNRLFTWLTKQVTIKTPSNIRYTEPHTNGRTHNLLNLVDFYGFEVLQTNSLEQFLINFTNEKIHFVLADLRLRMLQEEFVRDGLEWIIIDTSERSNASPNSSVAPAGKLIDLVEENCHGLLSILSNCANDHELERQVSRRFCGGTTSSENPSKEPSASQQKSPTIPGGANPLIEYLHQSFRLRHWAGPVVYSTRHFASKNRDSLPPHLPHQLYSYTADPLLRCLFAHDGRTPPSPMDSSILSSRLLATSNMELSLRNLFQKTCGGKSSPRVYYIRCLKPNEMSSADVCENALLKHQVRYHRLIDFLRVYRDGFTYNIGAFEFLERYKLLSLNTWPNWRHPSDIRLGVQVLMKDLQMKESLDWCFGGVSNTNTNSETLKIYLKGQRILSELEDFRRERLDDLALLIQKVWRGYRDWKTWNKMKLAHETITRAWRTYLRCKRKEQRKLWKNMRVAVRVIQQRYILWKRRLFLRQLIVQVRAELQQMNTNANLSSCHPVSLPVLSSTSSPGTGMLSPISKDWPYPPSYLEEASYHLKRIFHRWRCRLYRSRFNEVERAKMAEKVTASLLFRDKKSSYARSVSHPFLGDYIRLRQNSQWRRTTVMMMLQTITQSQQLPHVPSTASAAVAAALEEAQRNAIAAAAAAAAQQEENSAESQRRHVQQHLLPSQQLQIVFADLINKITRSSGKFLPIVLVVTTTSIMILDPRTLNIKYKIPATEIWRLSVSPYGDDICVLHLQHPRQAGGGSVIGPGEQGNLFDRVLSDDDEAYYQFGDEPSPTFGNNFSTGGCLTCSTGTTGAFGSTYYAGNIGGDSPSSSNNQHQCQGGSGGCGLFGGGTGPHGDSDSGHYVTSEFVKLTKGDLVLHTCHLIEMVTKIFLVVKNATGRGPELVISNEFPAIFNNQRVQLYFRYFAKKPGPLTSGTSSKPPPTRALSPPVGDTMIISTVKHQSYDHDVPHSNTRVHSPPPLSLPLEGPILTGDRTGVSSCTSSVPPAPPAPGCLQARDEPVIPPSQIKITRKKSTRMEFLIGGGSGGSGH